jgi:hypothetical protein
MTFLDAVRLLAGLVPFSRVGKRDENLESDLEEIAPMRGTLPRLPVPI